VRTYLSTRTIYPLFTSSEILNSSLYLTGDTLLLHYRVQWVKIWSFHGGDYE
jgi:hypothetical protein